MAETTTTYENGLVEDPNKWCSVNIMSTRAHCILSVMTLWNILSLFVLLKQTMFVIKNYINFGIEHDVSLGSNRPPLVGRLWILRREVILLPEATASNVY